MTQCVQVLTSNENTKSIFTGARYWRVGDHGELSVFASGESLIAVFAAGRWTEASFLGLDKEPANATR